MAADTRQNEGRASAALFGCSAAVVLILDLLTKHIAFQRLRRGEAVPLLPGCLDLRLSGNQGAVFGIGQGFGWFFILATVVATAAILWAVWKYGRSSRLLSCGLGLLLGGALGNLYDRIVIGFVRDFIDAYIGAHHWPTFNVADMAICVGAGMLVLQALLAPSRDGKAHSSAKP